MAMDVADEASVTKRPLRNLLDRMLSIAVKIAPGNFPPRRPAASRFLGRDERRHERHGHFRGGFLMGAAIPVVKEDFFEVLRDGGMIHNQAGISIELHTVAGPVLTANDRNLRIDDDAFVMAPLEQLDLVRVKPFVLECFEHFASVAVAKDYFDIHAMFD